MTAGKTPVYQTKQIRDFEKYAIQKLCINGDTLMSRAGKAAFDCLMHKWPHAKRIAIFCGAGNNGGDGYVLAELIHERGVDVGVYQVGDHSKLKTEALHAYERCQKAGIAIEAYQEDTDLKFPNVIVDAICGIGLADALRDEVVAILKRIEAEHVPVFAIDVPTGLNADTGDICGYALQAEATITFIGLKLGLITGKGLSYTGELFVNDLQLPNELFTHADPVAENVSFMAFTDYLKPRLRDWHKGLSGHVLVIGGDKGFAGAPRMAGMAALRVGAGLVTLATHHDNALLLDAECPELMCHGVSGADDLEPFLDKADVVVIGPGIGQSEWACELWDVALGQDKLFVVDADGLNILSSQPRKADNWVLTPHPGEAARLLDTDTKSIQQDRLAAAVKLQQSYHGVSVLKGAGSIIACQDTLPQVCTYGNPGMATAGMGDVLSGVIAGLLAQRVPLAVAAELGVIMHAMAGDMAAKNGERGMIATDLLPFLRQLSNRHIK